jgi:hypothetical protein
MLNCALYVRAQCHNAKVYAYVQICTCNVVWVDRQTNEILLSCDGL